MAYLNRDRIKVLWRQKYPIAADGEWWDARTGARTFRQDRKSVSFVPNGRTKNGVAMKRDGMSPQQWCNIMTGAQSDDIKLSTLFKMARILGCQPAELLA